MPKIPEKKKARVYWEDHGVQLWLGHVLDALALMSEKSVHMCVTSPPYWGLRDYGTGTWIGGDADCQHVKDFTPRVKRGVPLKGMGVDSQFARELGAAVYRDLCGKCGARRVDHQIGSEPFPDCGTQGKAQCGRCFVCNMVAVFRGVRRVLRDDGTLWINLGDTYSGGKTGRHDNYRLGGLPTEGRGQAATEGLPSGNLIGAPWRVALALQADGWILRQDIIWCLSGGTWVYVQSQKGEMPMMLSDAARLDPKTVKLWNGKKWTQVLGWTRTSRNADELEIVLRSGERIACTPNHQFPTARGLLDASDIVVGDELTSVRLPQPDSPHSPPAVTLDAAWFIGLYLAEGSRHKHHISISGHAKEVDRWERVKRVAEWYGGSATLATDGNEQTIRVHGRMLFALLDNHLSGSNAKTKALKVRCWSYSNEWLLELLLGYLEGDGHWDAKNNRWRLGFARNYGWERDLRVLAARIGFRLILNMSFADLDGRKFPTFRGEIRFIEGDHPNRKNPAEVIEIRKSRCRDVYDVGVEDDPHLFALASGILTHNCKPAPMPESVHNRCTKSHEHVFLFAKGKGYFYDAEAIKEKSVSKPHAPQNNKLDASRNDHSEMEKLWAIEGQTNKRDVWEADDHRSLIDWLAANDPDALARFFEEAKGRGDAWRIASQGYPGAHFAPYPPKLIEPMILAGTSARGVCAACGAPWVREVAKGENTRAEEGDRGNRDRSIKSNRNGITGTLDGKPAPVQTTGWRPGCECEAGVVPAVVLDPFMGSGTTGAVCIALGRRAVGVDLSEKYLRDNAVPRIRKAALELPGAQAATKPATGKVMLGGRSATG